MDVHRVCPSILKVRVRPGYQECGCHLCKQKMKNNLHPLHKQELYEELWLFALCPNYRTKPHLDFSIFPTIIYSSTFIPNKAQSGSSVSANNAAHGRCSTGTSCSCIEPNVCWTKGVQICLSQNFKESIIVV